MAYFTRFPLTPYINSNNVDYSVVVDITKRVSTKKEIKENFTLYDEYDIEDGETPEIVSYNLYGTTEYHWIILLLNDIIDPRYDWILSASNLRRYVEDKYGSDDANIYAIHHYEATLNNSIVVDFDDTNFPDKVSISNIDYEIAQNERKRRIKVLKKEFIPSFVTEFGKLING